MAGIRPPDNAAPPHRRNRLKISTVPYLFSVRNMFFSEKGVMASFDPGWPALKLGVAYFAPWLIKINSALSC